MRDYPIEKQKSCVRTTGFDRAIENDQPNENSRLLQSARNMKILSYFPTPPASGLI